MSETRTAAPALLIRRTFDAPRERVFAAWTTPELLRQWFGPPGISIGECSFDARHGGQYRIVMQRPGSEDFVARGTITEFRPPERLAYTFRWEEDEPSQEHETYVSIDFIARGTQTELVFSHENLRDEESRERHAEGWNGILDNFATFLC